MSELWLRAEQIKIQKNSVKLHDLIWDSNFKGNNVENATFGVKSPKLWCLGQKCFAKYEKIQMISNKWNKKFCILFRPV